VSIFLHIIGKPALKIFNFFNHDIKTVSLETVIACFADYFIPRKNITNERHKFFTRLQSADESIGEYVTDLKNLVCLAEFDTLRESLVKDVFIFGLHNNWQQLKQHLLREDTIHLDKALKICSSMELSKHRTEQLNNPSQDVLTVQTTNVSSSSRSRKNSQSKSKWSPQSNTNQKRESSSSQKRTIMVSMYIIKIIIVLGVEKYINLNVLRLVYNIITVKIIIILLNFVSHSLLK